MYVRILKCKRLFNVIVVGILYLLRLNLKIKAMYTYLGVLSAIICYSVWDCPFMWRYFLSYKFVA